MQSKRGELVPIAEALADLPGPVQALIPSPPARHHFTQADQVDQLVTASEADPDRASWPGVTWRGSMPCSPHRVRKRPTGRA